MTDRSPASSRTSPPGMREHRGIDVVEDLTPSGSDHRGGSPVGVGVVRIVVLNLFGPSDLLRITVGNRDQRPITTAVDGDDHGAPLGKVGNDRRRDAMQDLTDIDREGQHVVDPGEEFDPLTFATFDLEQTGALLDLAMTLVDVDRQTERAEDLVALADDDLADSLDPVNGSIGPSASMIEAKRLALGNTRRHCTLDHLPITFVDEFDPCVEGAAERRRRRPRTTSRCSRPR